MYADYESIDVAYINGYLAPLSLLMDYLTVEVGFTYYFRELTVDEDAPLITIVRDQLRQSIVAFNEANRRQFDAARLEALLQDECRLKTFPDWQTEIKPRLAPWLGRPIIDGLKKIGRKSVWPPTFIVDDFTQVLVAFFADQEVDCFTLEGDIKSELDYHWGGVGFEDLFFDANNRQYHLHFDLCD
jgi:hypothetical protein